MASTPTPILHFLRPMAPPRASTIRHFLRLSTSSKHSVASQQRNPQAPTQQDRNLLASRTASPTYPPQTMRSDPRPKKDHAIGSRRRGLRHPPIQRPYPTRHFPNTSYGQNLLPHPIAPLPEAESAPNLPYFVSRTENNELPVYSDFKRGGNLKLTLVRKVSGEVEALRDALRAELAARVGLERDRVVVNERTRQVVIKGQVRNQVMQFLRERRF